MCTFWLKDLHLRLFYFNFTLPPTTWDKCHVCIGVTCIILPRMLFLGFAVFQLQFIFNFTVTPDRALASVPKTGTCVFQVNIQLCPFHLLVVLLHLWYCCFFHNRMTCIEIGWVSSTISSISYQWIEHWWQMQTFPADEKIERSSKLQQFQAVTCPGVYI